MAHRALTDERATEDPRGHQGPVTLVGGSSALTQRTLERFLNDTRWELNDWRFVADREADYYDNNQLDAETLRAMEERGIPPLVRNLIAPAIDSVLGMEAMYRRELKVVPQTEDDTDVADALDVEFKQALTQTKAYRACSDAYKSQVSVGIGWVEVGHNLDPFRSRLRVRGVHRREMWWDWRAQEPDLSDARYLFRKKWYDRDYLLSVFPDHAQIIRGAASQWADWDWEGFSGTTAQIEQVRDAYSEFARTTLESIEWLDTDRDRLALYEVWYRVWERGFVMRTPDGRIVEFDRKNPAHRQAVAIGVPLEETVLSRVRVSFWVGPIQLIDMPSPFPHNRYPYVPFWGFREDRTGIPYGLIRRMMSPQDEVNARLSKMMWLLSAKRIEADEDAFADPVDRVLDEVGRPDAMIRLNARRKNPQSPVKITTDHQLTNQQFEVLQDASESVARNAGIYRSFMGQTDRGADSGVAINSLVEQGAITLAEINDNYAYARQLVGEMLLSLVKEEIGANHQVQVTRRGRREVVVLNRDEVDEAGIPYRENDITRTRAQVELEEVPMTPTYRAEQRRQLSEIVKALPPELQAPIIDLWVKATDLKERDEVVERLRQHTGYGLDESNPEAADAQRRQQEEEIAAKRAQVDKLQAEVERLAAQTAHDQAEARKTMAEAQRIIAEIAEKRQQIGHRETELGLRLAESRQQDQSGSPQTRNE